MIDRDKAREVVPAAPTIDRDALWREFCAREKLHPEANGFHHAGFDGGIDAVLAIARPAPVTTLDRAAVVKAYQETWEEWQREPVPGARFRDVLADRILALVRPATGVHLTTQEARLALVWLHDSVASGLGFPPQAQALAAKLDEHLKIDNTEQKWQPLTK